MIEYPNYIIEFFYNDKLINKTDVFLVNNYVISDINSSECF